MKLGFTNGQQFKANIRNLAQKKQINPQLLMQEVVLDELVDRISRSSYRNNLILKGGFLIASMLGIDTRSTRDIDTSIKGLPVTKSEILKVFTEVINVANDKTYCEITITRIEDIRVAADYAGFRIHLKAKIFASEVDTKIDVSTGDTITPREVSWYHHTIFNNQQIMIMAYNTETILAEKIETVIVRKDLNTRLKDYYDLYLFDKVQLQNIDFKVLNTAIRTTATIRGTEALLVTYEETAKTLKDSRELKLLWKKYQNANAYARGISYEATCEAVVDLIQRSQI